MKYLLLTVLACIPLAVLTVGSFDELRKIVPKVEDPVMLSERLKEARNMAKPGADKQFAADAEFVLQLESADLVEARPPVMADTASSLHAATEEWARFAKARDFVEKAGKLRLTRGGLSEPPGTKTDAEKEAKELADFAAAAQRATWVKDVPGSSEFIALVETREKTLGNAIARFNEQEAAQAALTAVRKSLAERDYGKTLTLLDNEDLKKVSGSELITELAVMRRRAEFAIKAQKLLRDTPATLSEEYVAKARGSNVLAVYDDFFRAYGAPPSDQEREFFTDLERRRAMLEMYLLLADLPQAQDVQSLLTITAQIRSARYVDQDLKNRIRVKVRDWLLMSEHGLLNKDIPRTLSGGEQEAVTMRGERLIGFFYTQADVATRFWHNKQDFLKRQPPLGEKRISIEDFKQAPGLPQYVKWANEFTSRRDPLLSPRSSKADWQDFAKWCNETQDQLLAYRELFGTDDEPDKSCLTWDFREHAALAREIVDQWNLYEQVQGN